jgi:predicted transcriptional regulator
MKHSSLDLLTGSLSKYTATFLLFEIAGADRLEILFELRKKHLRLSYLSKRLDFTVQETSRNVSRLAEEKLVVKEETATSV